MKLKQLLNLVLEVVTLSPKKLYLFFLSIRRFQDMLRLTVRLSRLMPPVERLRTQKKSALNTFNPSDGWFRSLFDGFWSRKKIRQTSAYYSRRCDQLELRWGGNSGRDAIYRLQIRSRCAYDGDPPLIQCQLTRLWFDPHMKMSAVKPKAKS